MGNAVLHNVYNVPLSCSFWDTLACIYLDRYKSNELELASVLFMVPNRRACQTLIASFVRQQGLKPAILPHIIPISEIDDEELFFNNIKVSDDELSQVSVINPNERLFLFARLIMSKPSDFGLKQISLCQAVDLAKDLTSLIDTACNQGLSFDKLEELVPEKYATHWQETLKLLKIITEFWPKILTEKNAIDACELKKLQLFKQAALWAKEKTTRPIVVAGITASFPAIVNMLKTVQMLPNGEIYFAGIDYCADDIYWQAIDESHPQFELKELLILLGIERSQIKNICSPNYSMRERFISEIMRPAQVSAAWQNISKDIDVDEAIQGLSLIECASQSDEAFAIALKMREILNLEGKTAALITYDRNLARRVSVELERFGIKIDDSAGVPLSLTPIGVYLRTIMEAAENLDSNISFVNLIKNPFTLCHSSAADFRKKAYEYELLLRQEKEIPLELLSFMQSIKDKLNQLNKLINTPNISPKILLQAHIQLAEDFSSSDEIEGKNFLWRGDAGKGASKFISKLLETIEFIGLIDGRDYSSLLSELMSYETVRARYGTHPRLSILGPIEARLCHFDYVILGEINEGIWPKPAQADMWMSRPMKKDFGFSLPEKNIGILAADLCVFLAEKNVILTRAERIDGVPMKKSRWLLRLETVLNAYKTDIVNLRLEDFVSWINKFNSTSNYAPVSAPAPCPPVEARPHKLSASALDLLISDPYSVFAKYILKLYPLDDLDIPLDQRDYGTLIHGIIEEFNNLYPAKHPHRALDILVSLGKKHFDEAHIDNDLCAFWWPKFISTATAYIKLDDRTDIVNIINETTGNVEYNIGQKPFIFTAKADRIDVLSDGRINIVDYKTGHIPTKKQVMSGHAVQLLLEGLIAQRGSFYNLPSREVSQLIYWQLGNYDNQKKLVIDSSENDILEKCEQYLLKLVSTFDFETTPYYSRPIPKYVSKNRDYEHLARIKEWSVQEEEDANGE